MSRRNVSLVRRRQVARALREMREESGLTMDAAAAKLEFSPSKLSRIENALQAVDVHVVKSMLDLYDAGGDRWQSTLELTRQARQRGWWRAYGLSDQGYVPLESEASLVRTFQATCVPGLLQTEAYVRASYAAATRRRTAKQIDSEIAVRLIRQRRLTVEEHPLELVAIVDEAVLRRPVGGPAVLRAQLEHLAEAADLASVTLQVLPTGVGAHPAMDGSFTLLSFGDLGEPDLAYVEYPFGSVHVEQDAEVAEARLVFDRLRSQALGPVESLTLIRRVAGQL